ncbi:MAG TPA: methenyltetrahydromethanopterin cyclohydrolase [Methanosarcinales archaeon]|nr:methenyltetrahydromethanopterin cyclohydrolase [Methanosarcinales archaeon]
MLSVNEAAIDVVDEMVCWSEELNIKVQTLDNGSTIIDCGIEVSGSYEAGLRFIEACMGGLGTASLGVRRIGNLPLAFIDVATDHPCVACLGAQTAGWQIGIGEYVAMGSGPARAIAQKPKEIFDRIVYHDDAKCAVIALESNKLPGEEIMRFIADECRVDVEEVVALVAPTNSLVGSVLVSGRVIETAVRKLHELGFDTRNILHATGTAPVAPVVLDEMRAIGSTNDSIIYYGSVVLTTRGFDEEIFKQVPAKVSENYGKPFYKTFEAAGYDFCNIDTAIFAPAEITVSDLDTGKTYHTGYLSEEVILESYEISGI